MKEFIDAVQQNEKHPGTFHIPPKDLLDEMKEGWFVKVAHNGERFWIEITSIEESGTIFGRVDNDLVNEHPFKYDDKIMFEKRHILDVVDFTNS